VTCSALPMSGVRVTTGHAWPGLGRASPRDHHRRSTACIQLARPSTLLIPSGDHVNDSVTKSKFDTSTSTACRRVAGRRPQARDGVMLAGRSPWVCGYG